MRLLFHQLNNQLGIILAHAELLEVKAADDGQSRARVASRGQGARRDEAPRAKSAARSEAAGA